MKKILYTFILLTLLISNLSASTLNLSISSNPARLNPILASDSASSEITKWIFDSLVIYDRDGNITPHIAKDYKFEDNLTLIFYIRDDVYFSDGVKLTVDDVIFTYNSITSKNVFTPYSSSFRYVDRLEKIDDFTLKVIYKEPYFKALEIWMVDILPKHILQNEKDLMTSNFNKAPIGTGSYKLESIKNSTSIKLKANPKHFLKAPKIEDITYQFLPDSHTNFLMLKLGKLDMSSLTPIQVHKQLSDDFFKTFDLIKSSGNAYTYLGFNLTNKKFKDKRVRRAINLAIDKDELIDILFFGYGEPCNGPFLKRSFAYNDSIQIEKQNLIKAKELLNEAGYNEKNPLEFEIVTNSNNQLRIYTAEIIQHHLAKIGVKVKIRSIEWQAFLNTVVHPRKFEAIILGWSLSLTPDAYPIWHSKSDTKGGFNFISYKNEDVDKLIERAEKSIDREEISKLYKEIFKLIVEDYPYVFLYVPQDILAVNKKIKNIEDSLIGIMHNHLDWVIIE